MTGTWDCPNSSDMVTSVGCTWDPSLTASHECFPVPVWALLQSCVWVSDWLQWQHQDVTLIECCDYRCVPVVYAALGLKLRALCMLRTCSANWTHNYFVVFETGSHLAQVSLELAMYQRLVFNSWFSFLCLLSSGITDNMPLYPALLSCLTLSFVH